MIYPVIAFIDTQWYVSRENTNGGLYSDTDSWQIQTYDVPDILEK